MRVGAVVLAGPKPGHRNVRFCRVVSGPLLVVCSFRVSGRFGWLAQPRHARLGVGFAGCTGREAPGGTAANGQMRHGDLPM